MPRKSATQRLSEITALLESYNHVEKEFFSWDVSFLGAMKDKLERKKALSTRMRHKIDEIVAIGKKELPLHNPIVDEYIGLSQFLPSRERDILVSFAQRISKGYPLSDKQTIFASGLIDLARKVRDGEIWTPSEDDLEEMKLIVELGKTYDPMWLSNNPSAQRSLSRLKDYFNPDAQTIYEERHLELARKKFAAKIRKIKQSKFSSGDIGYVKSYNREARSWEKRVVLVVGPAQVSTPENDWQSKLHLVFPVLDNGVLREIKHDELLKR